LLTGRAPYRTGIYGNEEFWRPHLPDAVTLPQHFRQNGYTTAGAGKVFHHTAGMNPPDQWDDFQLQTFDDPWYRRAEWYPWNKKVPNPPGHPFNGLAGVDGFAGEFDWGVVPQYAEKDYGDMRTVEYGERFLGREQAKPFFLALGLWHPHIPMFAPQKYFDLYPPESIRLPELPPGDLDDVPAVGKKFAAFRRAEHERIVKTGKWRDAVRAYLAAISFADAMVGRILATLEQSRHAANTIVVFWSDNGWHLGEKEHWHKSTLWQRATQVPLIVAGNVAGKPVGQAGVARRQAVSLLDLYPTLVEECGLPPRPDLDGRSLSPLLRNARARRDPAVICFEPGNFAIKDERWRYIRYHDGGEELYDELADRANIRNLAGDAKHARVKEQLARWLPKSSAPPAPERTQFDFDFATHTYRRK
jgi:arylsulfatase A-like enzyme